MWYNSLTTPEKVFFYIAVIGTVLLVVQIILMLVSFGGDADVDGDFGGDGDFDTPDGGFLCSRSKVLRPFSPSAVG